MGSEAKECVGLQSQAMLGASGDVRDTDSTVFGWDGHNVWNLLRNDKACLGLSSLEVKS